MNTIYMTIQMKETGEQIQNLMKEQKLTVRDVQIAMGFEHPQAIYKWLSGQSLPCIDNLMILSVLFECPMEDILVTERSCLKAS